MSDLMSGICSGDLVANELLKIRVKGWSEYNPRKDYKQPRWFALNNRILEDPDFFGFDGDEFKTWIYILCQCSQKNSDTISINLNHSERVCKISKKKFKFAILKLQDIEIIESVQVTNANVQDLYSTEQNITEQYNTEQNSIVLGGETSSPASTTQFQSLDFFFKIKEIKTPVLDEWIKNYPKEWLDEQFANAKMWCLANPKKAPKDSTRFLTSWLIRGWERHRKTIASNPMQTPSKGIEELLREQSERKAVVMR